MSRHGSGAARETLLREMFRAVDACDWASLPRFYAVDCIYERPGFPPFDGVEALVHFYQFTRPILSGQHDLDAIVQEGAQVCLTGRFKGTLRSGAPLGLRFADVYLFAEETISHRTTYFYAPLA